MNAIDGPDVRLTLAAEVDDTALVRSCVRDAVVFRSEDHERAFLVALSEIVINAIEVSASIGDRSEAGPTVVVELWGEPDARVEVHEGATVHERRSAGDRLDAGVLIAAALVSDLRIDIDDDGTHTRLGLGDLPDDMAHG